MQVSEVRHAELVAVRVAEGAFAWSAMSHRPVEPVPEVAEARKDELARIERTVDGGRVDVNARMSVLDGGDPLGRRDNAGEPKVAGTCRDQQVQARDGAPAGREHRVDQQHEAAADLLGQVRVVARGNRRRLVTLET